MAKTPKADAEATPTDDDQADTETDAGPHTHDYKTIVDKNGNQAIGFHTHSCRCGARVRRS